MTSKYGEESSDQEDLVDASGGSEVDEDASDVDEIQFSYCKTDASSILNAASSNGDNCSVTSTSATIVETRLKLALVGVGLCLLLSTFVLLFIHPLYLKQLELGGDGVSSYTAYGSLLFVSTIITVIFVASAAAASWFCKWTIKFYQFPIPAKGLCVISTCCGVAGTLCAISSYKRVPCHLQDPLKGAALVYSLVFYFFFCRKVMGLQRIFSATTAVVGLFISVDYGLCDEFRCRGKDVVATTNVTTGWQDRALWTLFYVLGIALWTLHLSLLEGHVLTLPGSIAHSLPQMSFLTTVSRIVSRNEPLLHERAPPKAPRKYKPKALHLVAWIHLISYVFVLLLGWIDIIPKSHQDKDIVANNSSFWTNTGRTLLCHINFHPHASTFEPHPPPFDYLANLSPHSILYNETVLKLRRSKRDITGVDYSSNRSHKSINRMRFINQEAGVGPIDKGAPEAGTPTTLNEHQSNGSAHAKINTEKHWRFVKNKIRQKIKFIDSHNQPVHREAPINNAAADTRADCQRISHYAWLFIFTYVVFAVSLFTFLVLSESTVFTVTIMTTALPLAGIFWSLFELETAGSSAFIQWAPEVSGELICSLLGTPIVFLGLGLLCRAHFRDGSSSIPHQRLYSSLS